MRYLLDADWIISFLNGRADAVALIKRVADEGIAVSAVTYGEILEGISPTSPPGTRAMELDQFVSSVDLLPIDAAVAVEYGQLRANLRSRGLLIPDNDLWIAATAVACDLTLVSRDSHFARVPGLRLLDRGQPRSR